MAQYDEDDTIYPIILPPKIGEEQTPRTLNDWGLTAEDCAKYRKQLEFVLQLARIRAQA